MQAIFERAYRMGVVSADERQVFSRRMNSRGWKANEPGSADLATERPELATSVGRRLEESGLSRDEVRHLAGARDGRSTPFDPPRRQLRVL